MLPGIFVFLEELLFQARPELAEQESTWPAVRGLGSQREKVKRLNSDQRRCSQRPGPLDQVSMGEAPLLWASASRAHVPRSHSPA